MTEDEKQKAYFEIVFGPGKPKRKRIEAALNRAHEIRQFEIRLYWQRSLFFWGFILALFTAFFVLLQIEEQKFGDRLLFFGLCCLGLFFSLAWCYIERGSSAWQRNWEFHIDYLENKITGKLHKTVIGDMSKFFSLSCIHRTIIFIFTLIWLGLSFFAAIELNPFILEKSAFIILNDNSLWYMGVVPICLAFPFFIINFWRTSQETIPEKRDQNQGQRLVTRPLGDVSFLRSETKEGL